MLKFLIDQQAADRAVFLKLIAQISGQTTDENGDPIAQPAPAIDQQFRNLAEQMILFCYDPDSNLTFDSWYKRYESIFTIEIANWQPAAKIRLLLQKFAQADYQKFADSILPQSPTQLTFDEVVAKLKAMFGYRETKFSLRHKCFSLKKEDSEDFVQFAARINKHGEKFDVTQCTADDLKVLLFVSGLKSREDSLILEKLLAKIDAQHAKMEAAVDVAARALIPKLTLQDLVNEAQRIINLKQDKSTIAESSASSSKEIFAIQQRQRSWSGRKSGENTHTPSNFRSSRPGSPRFNSSSSPPGCRFCAGAHWERDCNYKDKKCRTCGVTGHKAGSCVTAAEAMQRRNRFSRNHRRNSDPGGTAATVNQVSNGPKASPAERKFVQTSINGAKIRLQVDTASDLTIISKSSWEKLGKPHLTTVSTQPGSASGHPVNIWGFFECQMALNGRVSTGTCSVSSRLDLLGIDWITKLGLWDVPLSSICNAINVQQSSGLAKEAEKKFPQLFSPGLGRCTKTKVSLTLKKDAPKVFRKARPVPFAAASAIEDEIMRQQHLGVFTPVQYADFAAPIVAVKKKNGQIRLCGDYSTGLNNALEPNQFPLPTADQIFATLAGKKIFTVIDLSDAFLQMELDDDAKRLLTVNTHVGLFQVNRMQPGVKTAPGMFQELMTKMLSNLGGNVMAFIDDIILGAPTEAEHEKLLFQVLQRIQDYGFKLRIEKCNFGQPTIKFCGHIVDQHGTRPDPTKIQAIQSIPAPKDVSQLRSFLGAANYYGKFVKSINAIRGPLDELTHKDVKFVWEAKHQEAFEKIKAVLASDLILTHYDPAKPIVVAADACQYGKGGAIMHRFPDGTLHPVMFVSESFNAAERNYPQIQREAAALVFTVKRFHKFLYGRKFELQTDHKPLVAIFGSKEGIPVFTASRLQRYALTLLAYDFTVTYIDTASFGYVDVVSRLIAKHPRETDENTIIAQITIDEQQCFAIETAKMLPINFTDIKSENLQCPIMQQVKSYVEGGWPAKKKHIRDAEVAKYFDQRNELIVIEGCLFRGDRIVIPAQYRKQVLQELHTGHPGLVRSKMLARSKVYWPNIDEDIERTVKCCETCATVPKSPIKCTLKSWPVPSKPWSRIHADYAGPVNGQFYLVIVDAYSNWPEVFKTASTTSTKTIELFSEVFTRNGLCDTLVTDNGSQFISAEFKNFTDSNGIEHLRTAPYHPQSNGKAEKFVDLLKTGLSKADGNADQKLREFLSVYRRTPSYTLGGKSPSELINGRPMKTTLDLLQPPPKQSALRNDTMEQQFNEFHGAKWKEFAVGDRVYFKIHSSNTSWKWTPARIIAIVGRVNYTIELETGKIIRKAHANQLKKRHISNEIIDTFGLLDITTEEVEPTITPAQRELTHELTDENVSEPSSGEESFASADDEPGEVGPLQPKPEPAIRRTTRINAGIPAQRFGYND